MRLVSFIQNNNQELRWGILQPEQGYILDVQIIDSSMPSSLRQAVECDDDLISKLQNIATQDMHTSKAKIPVDNIALQAPYTNPPRNIICTGINYAEHLNELVRPLSVEQKIPQFPFIFTKPCTAIAHPDAKLDSHAQITSCLDYEVELAIIIGKRGLNIAKDDAMDYVFGYSIINDLSARDVQRRTSQWYLGKALDGSAPFGPCIVPKAHIGDPQNLHLITRINGETRQSSNTKNMIFDLPTLIHTISQGTSIMPGDIIATGTPSGVGMSFDPPKYLKSGDVMELEIENIGILRNTIA